MLRLFIPLIFVIVAGALTFLYTDPHYETIKTLRAEEREYDDALTKSKELQKARNALLAKRNTFAPDDLRKVQRLLPDNVDNIRLILDIDNIAVRYGLGIKGVSLSAPKNGRDATSPEAVGTSGDPIGSVELSFSINARYEDFLRFLRDLEKSIRIVDVESISFTVGEGDIITYTVRVKTFWLR